MPELVINVSNIMSPLCYSLIRIEPYNTCMFNCIYCYSRWYWIRVGEPRPRLEAFINFKIVARKIYQKGLKPIPARLATLTDPFQPVEENYKFTYKIMKTALKYNYPLVINTKSTLMLKNPWLEMVKKLSGQGLVIVQYSISSLDEHISRLLEPLAPTVRERLEAMRKLSQENIPVLLRLSPYVPGITLRSYDYGGIASLLSDIGVRQVIVEGLRLPLDEWKIIARRLGISIPALNLYSIRVVEGGNPLYKPEHKILLREYVGLRKALKEYNIGFATCKEGLFSLHTVEDCCGFYMFKDYVKRITLYEFFKSLLEKSLHLDEVDEKFKEICREDRYICSEKMEEYPKRIRKPLKAHERKLLKIIRDREKLRHITPEITIEEGYLKAVPLIPES